MGTCHVHTRVCPLCRTAFSNVRPLAAEKLAAQLPTPCKNQQHGCRACLAWSDRQLHEAECEMAVGQCPVLSCTSQVPILNVVAHLTSVHSWSEDFIHHKITAHSPLRFLPPRIFTHCRIIRTGGGDHNVLVL